jgi:hypothetical protein
MEARGPTIDVSSFGGGRCRTCHQHPQGACHRHLQHQWWPLPKIPTAAPRGPTIDASSFSDGRCRTCHQHPLGGPPSMSSTSVVAAVRNPDSSPKGSAIDVSSFSGGRCQTCRQHPQGACRRCLQHRWWSLLKISTADPGDRPSTSPASVVAAVGPTASTPRGPTIDVSSFGGDRCRTCRQLPQGTHRVNVCPNLVPTARIFLATPTRGAFAVNITTTNKATLRKSEGWSFGEKFLGPCGAQNPGIIIPLQKLSPNQQMMVQYY